MGQIRYPLSESRSRFLEHEAEADCDDGIDYGLGGVGGDGDILVKRRSGKPFCTGSNAFTETAFSCSKVSMGILR